MDSYGEHVRKRKCEAGLLPFNGVLIGRSLANNLTNMLRSPIAGNAVRQKNIDWAELLEQGPDRCSENMLTGSAFQSLGELTERARRKTALAVHS
jgi:hypothetical protein